MACYMRKDVQKEVKRGYRRMKGVVLVIDKEVGPYQHAAARAQLVETQLTMTKKTGPTAPSKGRSMRLRMYSSREAVYCSDSSRSSQLATTGKSLWI
jgi:hypothetical protein